MKAAPLTLRIISFAFLLLLLVSHSLPAFGKSPFGGFFGSSQQQDPTTLSDDDRWDNSLVLARPDIEPFTSVRAIAAVGKDVYVGGRFASAGGVAVNGIARWDGEAWSNVGGGIDFCLGTFCFPTVYALQVKGNELIAGGNFGSIGGVPANKIARWDGSKWSTLGDGLSICDWTGDCVTVQSIALSGDDIYATGNVMSDVKEVGGTLLVEGFARWDGANWSKVGGGVIGDSLTASINALAINGKDAYIGGNFRSAGGSSANNIAIWNGSEWSALGGGVDGCLSQNPSFPCAPYVATIAVKEKDVYAGGRFTSAGGVPANNIARWDGERWHALGSGANGLVLKLAVHGDWVYAGGTFTEIDGVKARGLARFDGERWSPVGSGVDGFVDVIEFSDDFMYVAGAFHSAGGKQAFNFARWALPGTPADPLSLLPRITGISRMRKKLFVSGERFDQGAVLLLNGMAQITQSDPGNPSGLLIASKSGKLVKPGVRLQVQNHDGKLSPEFIAPQ